MNNYADKYRYGRYTSQVRRRKRNSPNKNSLSEKIIKQLAAALLIFLIIWGIKSINSGLTNYISSKIKWVVTESTSIANIYEGIDGVVEKIKGKKLSGTEDEPFDNKDDEINEADLIPAGAGFSEPLDNTGGFIDKPGRNEDDVSRDETAGYPDISLLCPVEGIIAVRFGKTVNDATGEFFFHPGIDIEAENGAPVLAADTGTVAEAGSHPYYNKYIKINHKNGVSTIYAHCYSFKVEEGQVVEKGEPIAVIGGYDTSVGAHLHFEVWVGEEPVDPEKFFL